MQTRIAFGPIVCGLALLAVGLFPGVLSAMANGIENFRRSITGTASPLWERRAATPTHTGFIALGIVFVLFGLFATWRQ